MGFRTKQEEYINLLEDYIKMHDCKQTLWEDCTCEEARKEIARLQEEIKTI